MICKTLLLLIFCIASAHILSGFREDTRLTPIEGSSRYAHVNLRNET